MARYAFFALAAFLVGCSGPRLEAGSPDMVTVYTGAPGGDFAGAIALATKHCSMVGRRPEWAGQVAASGHVNSGHYITYHCVP